MVEQRDRKYINWRRIYTRRMMVSKQSFEEGYYGGRERYVWNFRHLRRKKETKKENIKWNHEISVARLILLHQDYLES